ncbi:MAG: SPFH/Band 7/PHB domain protein [Lachnospiraceae bacterium]|jgi:regulator of protease activity HflC (stomatin/prohibitin superfamily)|nr:SPFH/Band 7/PHB domain protein [Lachnospiraceae bacterium]MBQ4300426.1 SPFH/Band 7/PHB domain protein [Lachnospiraceae bacterium]
MGVIILLIVLVVILILGIKIVPQQHAYVIERLGKYKKTITAGLNIIIPVIDVVRVNVNLKEQVADFPPQPVITKDNVTMQIDTVVYFKIVDPAAYAYGVENPIMAIENLTATTLRNIIGDMELDETLTSRDKVNGQLCAIIDEATDPWGIKINRVELKNIMPPKAIQESMEKQMKAERERREQILIAEGEKKSAVLKAEGEKESAVLRAEAAYVATVKEAEAHAESIRLHKEAEANGVVMMKQAEAEGIAKLKEAGMSTDQIVKLRSLNALETASKGQATKIIIPSDIQSVAGFVEGVKESL